MNNEFNNNTNIQDNNTLYNNSLNNNSNQSTVFQNAVNQVPPTTLNNQVVNNEKKVKKSTSIIGILLVILCLIGFGLFVINNIYGLGVGIVCFLLALIAVQKNPPFIFLAIVMPVVLCSAYLLLMISNDQKTKEYQYREQASKFVDMARGYIYSARDYARGKKIVGCGDNIKGEDTIKLSNLESGYDLTSPFDNKKQINVNDSFVALRATNYFDDCIIHYSIYLTDGEYSIGNSNNPVKDEELDISVINKP